MPDTQDFGARPEALTLLQTHLEIFQGVIARMAANSTSVKTWCVTVVSAILVMAADRQKAGPALLALIPALLFSALDVYCLALEKGFRESYAGFVKSLHQGTLTTEHFFAVQIEGDLSRHLIEAAKSFSVWGFCLGLVLSILITWQFLLQ